MSDKIARLGIERDNNLMYYIKNGDVWATPRKQKGQPKGRSEKVAETGLDLDYSRYIYYLDGDGDVARKERALGGGGRKAKTTKAVASSKPSRSAPPARKEHEMVWTGRRGTKSDEQLDREIEECLAQAKSRRAGSSGGNGNGPAATDNGNGSRSAATGPKRGGRKTKRR
ncbi:MAG TPA: hypothetical protein VLE97_09940 [Gaiellaceae bacterium]|nr:hypothetical protein [Gaiellaceae bacterium]